MKLKTRIIITVSLFFLLMPRVTEAGVSVIGGLSHKKQAKIGETYKGLILIRNTGDAPQEVKIYQNDYLFFFDGRNAFGEPGKDPRSNANWMTFNPHRQIIPPNGTATVNYTVKVPDSPNLPDDPNLVDDPNRPNDPNLVGTYWSVLMVEGIPETSPESSKAEKDKIKMGITQVVRYAIQMVTHIGNTGERKLKFLDTKLLKETEKRTLQVDIENIGERYLAHFLWAELYDEQGRYIGKFEERRLGTFPGTSVRYRIDLSQVPEGNYKAMVVADCGGDYIFGANYNLKFEK